MEDYEEVERYQKLLEDWKPGPPTSPKFKPKPSVSTLPTHTNRLAPSPPKPTPHGVQYGPGAILLINRRTLAVYRRFVPEKEYHLVLSLCPNQAVKIQGVALEGHDVEELGSIPSAWLDRLQNEMTWDRDLIVFHCYRYEDVAKIPTPDSFEEPRGSVQPTPAPPPAQETLSPPVPVAKPEKLNGNLHRGQRLQIKFGSNTWDAVYWGKDDQGQVIAHQTYERWSLMHLDLNRFSNGLVIHSDVDAQIIQVIEQSLLSA